MREGVSKFILFNALPLNYWCICLTVPYRLYSIPQLYVIFSWFKLWFYSFNDFCHFFVCVAVYGVWPTGNGWNLSKAFSGMNTPCWYWHCSHLWLNVCTCSDTCPLCSNLYFKFVVFTWHSFNFKHNNLRT